MKASSAALSASAASRLEEFHAKIVYETNKVKMTACMNNFLFSTTLNFTHEGQDMQSLKAPEPENKKKSYGQNRNSLRKIGKSVLLLVQHGDFWLAAKSWKWAQWRHWLLTCAAATRAETKRTERKGSKSENFKEFHKLELSERFSRKKEPER